MSHDLLVQVACSLRYRNGTEITVGMCELKPYPEWLSCRPKSYPVSAVKCEHSLRLYCGRAKEPAAYSLSVALL